VSTMRANYIRVLIIWMLVLAALFAFERHYS
jgi:hypothetical protein